MSLVLQEDKKQMVNASHPKHEDLCRKVLGVIQTNKDDINENKLTLSYTLGDMA
jgi:hypothetical protein